MSPCPAITPGSTALASPGTRLSASPEGSTGLPGWRGGRSRAGPPSTAAPSSPLPPAEDPTSDSRAKSPGSADTPSAEFSPSGAEGSTGAALGNVGARSDASPEGAGTPEATSSSGDHSWAPPAPPATPPGAPRASGVLPLWVLGTKWVSPLGASPEVSPCPGRSRETGSEVAVPSETPPAPRATGTRG